MIQKFRFLLGQSEASWIHIHFFAFDQLDVKTMIEKEGFLYPGLGIYGDNVYANTSYIMVPFCNVGRGSKDAFNFSSPDCKSLLNMLLECLFTDLEY